MSTLVFTENWGNKFNKRSFEVVSYAKELSKLQNSDVTAITIGDLQTEELEKIGNYGASKIICINHIDKADNQTISNFICEYLSNNNFSNIIFGDSFLSKSIAPRIAIKINAGIVSNVTKLPQSIAPFQVEKKSFSGKAFEIVEVESSIKVLVLSKNSFELKENFISTEIEKINIKKSDIITVNSTEKNTGKISLSDAEIIVSAGRGLKGPENWNMIEELANVLNAGTACSKPVSDLGWRSHSEHVGQTGKTIAPNLYFAIGISGAIQHLAGVNSSKTIVVINTDSEAPFFKAADYGIVGDAFEIVPKLIEELKSFKN